MSRSGSVHGVRWVYSGVGECVYDLDEGRGEIGAVHEVDDVGRDIALLVAELSTGGRVVQLSETVRGSESYTASSATAAQTEPPYVYRFLGIVVETLLIHPSPL
jgi:hypothetical protein